MTNAEKDLLKWLKETKEISDSAKCKLSLLIDKAHESRKKANEAAAKRECVVHTYTVRSDQDDNSQFDVTGTNIEDAAYNALNKAGYSIVQTGTK